eukprot:991003-Rhodomonas_salina.1
MKTQHVKLPMPPTGAHRDPEEEEEEEEEEEVEEREELTKEEVDLYEMLKITRAVAVKDGGREVPSPRARAFRCLALTQHRRRRGRLYHAQELLTTVR